MSDILTVIAQLSVMTFIITSMLAMGLSLTIKQIMDPLHDTKVVLLALLANFVLVPALAYLITVVIPLDGDLATGLIIVGCAACFILWWACCCCSLFCNRPGSSCDPRAWRVQSLL